MASIKLSTEEMEDHPLRPTGNMERFNIIRNYVKFYNNVQVTAVYTVPKSFLQTVEDGRIEGLVCAALKETVKYQPILGVTIEDEGTKEPKWVRLETIDLSRVVKVVNADPNADLDQIAQDAHQVPFERLHPLWSIVVVVQNTVPTAEAGSHVSFAVGFFAHHAIADGLSCGAFHLTFLDALNTLISTPVQPPSTKDQASLIAVPQLPLIPNLELKTTLSVSILFVLIEVFKAFIYSPIDPLNWSGPTISADTPRPPISNTRSFFLLPSTVTKLVARCRKEKTTITALVTILVARKLAVMYPTYTHFTGNVPFSLRKFTGHSPRDMGCYVSNVPPCFSSEAKTPRGYISCRSRGKGSALSALDDGQELWDSARAVKQLIDKNTSTMHNQNVNLLKFVSDLQKYFLGLLGSKRQHAFEVSNIGVIDGGVGQDGAEERATFDKVMFSTGHCTFGNPYAFCIATAKNGYMTVALNWETGVVGDEEAMELLVWLEGELKGLASA